MRKNLLLLLFCVLMSLPALARDFEYTYEGQTIIYTVIDEEAKTCETKEGLDLTYFGYGCMPGNNISGKLILPEKPKDGDVEYTLTEISILAFSHCSGLTSVEIPNSVTSIGNYAFNGCSDLTSVTIPNSVTSIGKEAFSGCSGLTSVVIPASVRKLGNEAFAGCENLKTLRFNAEKCEVTGTLYSYPFPSGLETVIIGDNVTLIPEFLLFDCSNLTSVEIPNSVTSIGRYAFAGCSGLTSVTIPNSVTSIGSSAFSSCSGLASVVISNSVTSIGELAFADCSGLTSVVIPNSVTYIGKDAFSGCSGLTSVDIPNSVTSIGSSAFKGCSSLTSVDIPNSVTSIGSSAFKGCSGLTSVIIPNSVTSIGSSAFNDCSGLKKSAYPNNLEKPFSYGKTVAYNPEGAIIEDGWIWGPDKSEIRFVPYDLEGDYTIPNSVTSIGQMAFSGCSGLTSVVIPNSVTSISDGTFYGCSGLTSVTIPNSVTSIGQMAFYECGGLTSVVIPNSVTSIGHYAFKGCSGLTSVIIGNSVTSIGAYAFSDCSGLKKSAYPNNLKNPFSYGYAAAYDPEGAIIEDGCIWGPEKKTILFVPCDLEGEFTIPEYITSIGLIAFYGCSGLTSVVIPKSVTSIGQNSFNGCYGLTNVTALPASPAVMNDNSFEGLYDKIKLSVPDESVNQYLATNWSLFKNIRTNTAIELSSFSDGVLEYRLNPTDMTAMVIGAKSYYDLQIPERFTDDSDAANPVRYYIKGIGYGAFHYKNVKSVTFNSRSQIEYIGDYAFSITNISAISIPESVTYIGKEAFRGTALGSIDIPASVKVIGDYAFYNTDYLSNVILHEGLESIGEKSFSAYSKRSVRTNPLYMPSTIKSVANSAFDNFRCSKVDISDLTAWFKIDFGSSSSNPLCATEEGLYLNGNPLKTLQIPDGITEIKPYAFYNCKSLTKVTIPEGIEKIGSGSFADCANVSSITIPSSVTEIGDYVFSQKNIVVADGWSPIACGNSPFNDVVTDLYWGRPIESLTSYLSNCNNLSLGGAVSEIPDKKFNNLSISSLTIGNGVKTVGAHAFSECRKLNDVKFGSNIATIGANAFSGCRELTEVVLPPAVETIGAQAFSGAIKLASIIMGHNVKSIGEEAFYGCPAKTVSITAQTPPTAANSTFSNYTGKLYLQGQKAIDAYYDAFTCWDRFSSYVMIDAEKITVEGADQISGKAGDSFQLTATVWPENVTLPQIFWRSTNPEIATVDANGLVTLHVDLESLKTRAQGEDDIAGLCTIIAETLYNDGPIAEISVSAEDNTPILVETLTIDPTEWSGEEGSEFTITATVTPEDATFKTLTWTSSDESVATVDAKGNVKVLKEGNCIITVATIDGSNLTAECHITGLAGVEGIFGEETTVDVYDMQGVLMKKGCEGSELKELLTPGVYILRSGDRVVKTVIR